MAELATQAAELTPELAPEPVSVPEPAPQEELTSLDFDLGMGVEESSPVAEVKTAAAPEPEAEVPALDFDLAADSSAAPSQQPMDADSTVVGFDVGLPEAQPAVVEQPVAKEEPMDLDFDLGFESTPVEAAPAAQPVAEMAVDAASGAASSAVSVEDDGVEFDVNLTESTFLGRSMPEEAPSFDMSSIDLDLNAPAIEAQEQVAASPEMAQAAAEPVVENDLVSTAVNNDFATEQAETMLNPQFGIEPDLLPEQDFSLAQAATVVNPQFGSEDSVSPEFDISANEEVATKLDLAKAYEEMGDFEGARELLQEVLSEGDASQKEKAQAILAKIGD